MLYSRWNIHIQWQIVYKLVPWFDTRCCNVNIHVYTICKDSMYMPLNINIILVLQVFSGTVQSKTCKAQNIL
jgi:hypothetical protein